MSAPATDPQHPTSGSRQAAGPAKRPSADDPSLQRLFVEVALIGGGALLITSSVIHLLLWSESYRDVAPLGQVVILMGVVGILFALALVRFATLGLVVASAVYLAATTAVLLLVSRFELLGYQNGFPSPYTPRSIGVPIIGLALLAGAARLIAPPGRKPKPEAQPEKGTGDRGADEQAPEPPTPAEAAPVAVERIRWPAERPRRMLATQPVAEAPAPAPEPEPQEEPAPLPEAVEAEEPEEAPAAAEMPAEPEPQEEAAPLPEAVEAEEEAPAAAEMPAEEPEEEAPAAAEVPAEEPEPEPEVEAAEPVPPQESTVELAAVPEPVPESIPEPLRSTLAREQENLGRLIKALGADDPRTLTLRSNIAAHYLSAGDAPRAALLQEEVAADSARILGAGHPHTATAERKAAQWRKLAKKRRKPKAPASG